MKLQAVSDRYVGTRDGVGAADNDHPYVFGRRPSSAVPFPFSTRQYVRLLLMRSRLADQSLATRTTACDQLPIEVVS